MPTEILDSIPKDAREFKFQPEKSKSGIKGITPEMVAKGVKNVNRDVAARTEVFERELAERRAWQASKTSEKPVGTEGNQNDSYAGFVGRDREERKRIDKK